MIFFSKKVQIAFLLFSTSQLTTNCYGMFCSCDGDYLEEEIGMQSSFSSSRTRNIQNTEYQKVKNQLKTSSNKIAKHNGIPEDKYKAIQPIIFDDGSRVTSYQPSTEKKPFTIFSEKKFHAGNQTFSGAKFGSDDREHVIKTSNIPWRVHGHLEITFPNGESYTGSGTVINHRHVLTAGHCIYDKKLGGWATSVKFSAAQNGDYYPIQPAYTTHLVTVNGWKKSQDSRFDMGMLILDRDLGEETGWYGISADTNSFLKDLEINVTGYPGEEDKGHGTQMWTMPGKILDIDLEQFKYTIDTTGGQSGSGVWAKFEKPKGFYCVGIHTSGWENRYNTTTRISNHKFDTIVSWINTSWK